MSENPYNQINPLSFLIRKIAAADGKALFHVEGQDQKPFDMCVFRRYLFDYLMDNLLGSFRLWNVGNDYRLELATGWDEQVLRDEFRVI